jgi:hypothetical protein
MAGQLAQNNGTLRATLFSPTIKMPESINGTAMPKDPVSAFFSSRNNLVQYSGYCVLSMSCERRGIFLVARNAYHEVQQIAQVIQGAFR